MSIRGWFVWEELMTTDKASAASFYEKVAGVKTKTAPFDPNYSMFVGSNGNMGGLMSLPDEAKAGGTRPMWISYIGTPNVDETARAAAALGGQVHKAPWDIADGGRIAILSDPQGAVFAIYSNPKASDAPPSHVGLGHASWHELATTDYRAAFNFYQRLFGWHVVNDMEMPGTGVYRLFAPEGVKDGIGGIYTKAASQPGSPAWLPYLKVADVKKATGKAKSLGAQILHGPADVPGGMITMAVDPQGVMFAIHQSTAMPAAAPAATPKKATPKKASSKTSATKVRKAAKAKKKAAPKKKKAAAKRKSAKKVTRKAGSKK
ncbi:MAG TPA: VOC family protein [Vicinamibacterales bacterium]|nr:VOC family protein [Vicinamibacterales bacterium]